MRTISRAPPATSTATRSRTASGPKGARVPESLTDRGAKIAARNYSRTARRTMLQQQSMIERTRRVCREDGGLVAAMMYGSFAQNEGDEFSDIEFILFFEDGELANLDQEEWVSRISPVGLYFVNEYGNGTAIFENLVRGEFHVCGGLSAHHPSVIRRSRSGSSATVS